MEALTRDQIVDKMLELDKAIYGQCYEYMDEFGNRHRLDPTRVKRTELKRAETINIHKPSFLNGNS